MHVKANGKTISKLHPGGVDNVEIEGETLNVKSKIDIYSGKSLQLKSNEEDVYLIVYHETKSVLQSINPLWWFRFTHVAEVSRLEFENAVANGGSDYCFKPRPVSKEHEIAYKLLGANYLMWSFALIYYFNYYEISGIMASDWFLAAITLSCGLSGFNILRRKINSRDKVLDQALLSIVGGVFFYFQYDGQSPVLFLFSAIISALVFMGYRFLKNRNVEVLNG
jgi:hypothetical protein